MLWWALHAKKCSLNSLMTSSGKRHLQLKTDMVFPMHQSVLFLPLPLAPLPYHYLGAVLSQTPALQGANDPKFQI